MIPIQDRLKIASQCEDVIMQATQDERGIHAETAIASAARMAGRYLLRSFGYTPAGIPGQLVLSERANEEGPRLVQQLFEYLRTMNIAVGPADIQTYLLDQSHQHDPHLSVLESEDRLNGPLAEVANASSIGDREAADILVLTAALLIRHASETLDPQIGAGIAAYGFVEGTKTAVPRRA